MDVNRLFMDVHRLIMDVNLLFMDVNILYIYGHRLFTAVLIVYFLTNRNPRPRLSSVAIRRKVRYWAPYHL